jgi:formyltetrahydrofolate synthetase
MHGGLGKVVAGKPLPKELTTENLPALQKGCANLVAHITNALSFGVPVVVAVNRFTTDTDNEIELVRKIAVDAGAEDAVPATHWAEGGKGAVDLANAVIKAAEKPANFRFLYPLDIPIKDKIEIIATKVYGADGVDYLPEADAKVKLYTKFGYDKLPICMAKTHLSLSHDPALKGVPKGWRLPIRDIRASVGAGFLYPLCGEMKTMPALSRQPAFMGMDIDENGVIRGLS